MVEGEDTPPLAAVSIAANDDHGPKGNEGVGNGEDPPPSVLAPDPVTLDQKAAALMTPSPFRQCKACRFFSPLRTMFKQGVQRGEGCLANAKLTRAGSRGFQQVTTNTLQRGTSTQFSWVFTTYRFCKQSSVINLQFSRSDWYYLGGKVKRTLLDTENEFIDASRSRINADYDGLFAKYRVLTGIGVLLDTMGICLPEEADTSRG